MSLSPPELPTLSPAWQGRDTSSRHDKASLIRRPLTEIQLRLPSLAPIVLHRTWLVGSCWRVLHVRRVRDFIVDRWSRSQLRPQLGILFSWSEGPRRIRGEVDWLLGEGTSTERPSPLAGIFVTTSWPCPLGITEHRTLPDNWRSKIVLFRRVRKSLAICLHT